MTPTIGTMTPTPTPTTTPMLPSAAHLASITPIKALPPLPPAELQLSYKPSKNSLRPPISKEKKSRKSTSRSIRSKRSKRSTKTNRSRSPRRSRHHHSQDHSTLRPAPATSRRGSGSHHTPGRHQQEGATPDHSWESTHPHTGRRRDHAIYQRSRLSTS